MKKSFTLLLFLLLLNVKLNAQTQFPFYGFELSNYEVGDTLIYRNGSLDNHVDCDDYTANIIINKEFLSGNDSIKYTIRRISDGVCNSGGTYHAYGGVSTVQSLITNDTVYNNENNLPGILLNRLDTSNLLHFDSAYVKYDTINGLKHIKFVNQYTFVYYRGYEILQNLGIIEEYQSTEDDVDRDWSTTLIYAHLAHYGIYGKYVKVYDDIYGSSISNSFQISPNPTSSTLNLSIPSTVTISSIEIFDLIGRKIISQSTIPKSSSNYSIDMSALPKGYYFVRIHSSEGIVNRKFVLQ